MRKQRFLFSLFFTFIVALFAVMPLSQTAHAQTPYNPVPYEDIGPILEKHAQDSDRVTLEILGQSALGHDLYGVVISDPEDDLEQFKSLRKEMINNPNDAREIIKENPDFKVPFLINGSIHGNEYAGTDAVLKLIDRFAYANDEETKRILENNILIFNVNNNPDGRILGTRQNGNGFDINRDHVTLSQPEAAINVDLITEWNPMVHLDLHGYVRRSNEYPGLIEPSTIPHNTNYEYDLYIKWALDQAEAMEEELVMNKQSFETDMYKNMKGTHIPYRDAVDGWDDYPPIFTPVYAINHGIYGHTLETPTNSVDGVDWHVHAVIGALNFATENKVEMTEDQLEIWRRGIEFDHPQHEADFFPRAYILPASEIDPSATIKAVNSLLRHSVEVKQADEAFTVDGKQYRKGTYIVQLDQPKASLANTLLWDGEDISEQVSSMYDISAWSLPELWGFEAIATHSSMDISVKEVEQVSTEGKLIGTGPYEITNSSVASIVLVNKLIDNNISVFKANNGNFYVEQNDGDTLKELVQQSPGITLSTKPIPENAKQIDKVNIALLKDRNEHGIRTALKQLEFQITEIEPQEIAEDGLDEYDVLVVNGSGIERGDSYKQNIDEFIDRGGKYIAIGSSASNVAAQLDLVDATINSGGRNSNGIVKVNYKDVSQTAGYADLDFGFVYNPVWYTNIESDRVIASYAEQDFFRAGFWKKPEVAQGQPAIIKGHSNAVTLLGLEVGFRAHPEHLYRLVSNAIYPGDETILTTVSGMKERVERYQEEGEFGRDDVVRLLQTHLTSVGHYAEKGSIDKATKHMKGFKLLIENLKENELVSEKVYKILNNDANSMLTKWQ